MIKVDQTVSDSETGNCFQAALASLFEKPLDEVINIIDHVGGQGWGIPFMDWVETTGYEYEYFVSPTEDIELTYRELKTYENIKGHFLVSVKSKNYDNTFHAVIVNTEGIVVHDPSLDRKWLGLDIVIEGCLGWYVFEKR